MAVKADQLADLLDLAQVAFASEQSKLAALSRRESAIRAQLETLIQSRAQSALLKDAESAAMKAGAEVRWHRWIDTRRETLNRELAQVMALRAQSVAAVRRAFGKKEALAGLLSQSKAADKLQRARRQDQTS